MEKEQKQEIIKLCIIFVVFVAAIIVDRIIGLATVIPGPLGWLLKLGIYLVIFVFAGAEVLKEAAVNIVHGEVFDECFLMTIASLGAFALGIYNGVNGMDPEGFEEACAIMIFYNIGELFSDIAVDNSRKSIEELMDIRPDVANVVRPDGTVEKVSPEEVEVGDIIEVKKGEKIPLDGVVTEGNTVIDMMALTGETDAVNAGPGTELLSGSISIGDTFRMKVTKPFGQSTVSKILELVENAADKKTKTENFIDRFAKVYTPVVIILCLLVAVVPSIITGAWDVWIYRAISLLVISCPCALVVSVPLAFYVGIGLASREHILVKGSNYLELLSKADIYVCDKTGTLTVGRRKSAEDTAEDPIKPEAKEFISTIQSEGARVIMLSGDREDVAKDVADTLGIKDYCYGLLPQDKHKKLEEIMAGTSEKDVICYLGDGINDAPSLMTSDVGISMGSIGTDAAVEASDIVLMQDNLLDVLKTRKIAKRTMRIAKENIVISLAIKVIILVLSILGITNIWFAVFGDVGVTVIAVLNALRAGKYKA